MYGFCTTCHNGTGANTNVVSGVFEGDYADWGTQGDGIAGAGLNAGGFESAYDYTGLTNRTNGPHALTGDDKRHNATGADDVLKTAWGGGLQGPGTSMTLICTSCHDPHGTDNNTTLPAIQERYRILRNTVNGVTVNAYLYSNESPGTHDYTTLKYRTGFTSFCTACHTQYSDMGPTDYDAGDGNGYVFRYRHNPEVAVSNGDQWTGNQKTMAFNLNNYPTGILPLKQSAYRTYNLGGDGMTCLTCHQAHGTTSTVTDAQRAATPAHSSTLLRFANQGVCEACHMK
jgi:formate-dependent nitrite reductase cytochrome c552 subunit